METLDGKHRTTKQCSSFWLGSLADWQFKNESTEDMIVLTKIMHSIEKIADSLHPEKKIQVRLASDRTLSSDWARHKIILPTNYLWLQESFSCFAHIVDLWTAIALHEAGHMVLSQDLSKERLGVSHVFIITHIVEDYWVEKWIVDRFPGYLPYFEQFRHMHFSGDPDLGEDEISKRINDFLYLIQGDGHIPHFEETEKAVDRLRRNWDQAKAENKTEAWNRIALGRLIFEILFPDGIIKENKEAILQLSNPGEIEPSAPSSGNMGGANREVLSPFLLSGKVKAEQTIHYHEHSRTGQKISWASEQMIESWMDGDGGFQQKNKNAQNSCIIRRPELDEEAIAAYGASYRRVKPYILKLRNKFEKANAPRIYESLRLQQGSLDEEALYRAAYSTDLFKIEGERWESIGKWDLTLLIDESRSTDKLYDERHGLEKLRRYEVAIDLSVLFAEAFRQLKMIDLRIFAYSTASHSSMLQLDELYSPDMKKTERLGLIRPKYATPEYLALKEMTLKLDKEGRADSQKLLFILSDGQPDDYDFGSGDEHKRKIKEWTQKWNRNGFAFAHIALSEDSAGKDTYPESIQFEHDYSKLIAKVCRWISRVLSKS